MKSQSGRKRWRRVVLGIALGLGLCYLGFHLYLQLGLGMPGRIEFAVHHRRYERIVDEVKKRGTAPGGEKIDGLMTSWNRGADGRLVISIMTLDWHHAGSYGYVYSEASTAPALGQEDDDLPGRLIFLDRKMRDRWWSAYNNLD